MDLPPASFATPPGYDFERTLRVLRFGSSDPTVRLGPDFLARAAYFPAGPATIELRREPDGVAATAWGPGAADAIQSVPRLLGLHDHAVQLKGHPVVERLCRDYHGLRLLTVESLAAALVPNILQQQVEWRAAAGSWRQLVRAHADQAPGDLGLMLPLSLGQLRALPLEHFVTAGVPRRRAATLREVGRLGERIDGWFADHPGTIGERLQKIPGIGPWTVEHTLGFYMGHADALPIGDHDLPHTIAFALSGKVRSSDAEMQELLEPFRGQRWRVVRWILAAGIKAPRLGPRLKHGRPSRPWGRRGSSHY